MFKTAYSKKEPIFTPSGSKFKPTYEYEINDMGQKVLTCTGEKNIYDEIQLYAEETKIENIMARVTAGDTSMLRPDGIYADIAEAPKNLLEARQQMQKLENVWGSLPNQIKKKYNNDVEEFIGASGTTEWLQDMGIIPAIEKAKEQIKNQKTEQATETLKTEGAKKDES